MAKLKKTCACPPAKWSKCSHSYAVREWMFGKLRSKAIDDYLKDIGEAARPRTLAACEPFAIKIREIMRANRGVYVAPPSTAAAPAPTPDGATVDKAIEKFGDKIAGTYESWKNEAGMLARVAAVELPGVGRFGALALGAVDEDTIERVYKAAVVGKANGTRRKYGRVFRSLFRFAVAKKLIATSPITSETAFPAGKPKRRIVRLSPDVEGKLIDAAIVDTLDTRNAFEGQRLADMIVAASESGGRHGELLGVKWSDIDAGGDLDVLLFAAREKGARKTKTPRRVSISARLRDVLESRRLDAHEKPFAGSCYVFGDELGGRVHSVKKAWLTAVCRAYGIAPKWTGTKLAAETRAALKALNNGEGLWWTDLRHTAALKWHRAGLELTAIAKALGHADLGMLAIYLGIDADEAIASFRRVFPPKAAPKPGPKRASRPQNRSKTDLNRRSFKIVRGRKIG